MEDRMIYFNGVDLDRGGYFRQPMTLAEVKARLVDPGAAEGGRERALVDWADPDDLRQAGWGVIVHEDEDPAIIEALEPLLTLRGRQAGKVARLVFTEEDRAQGDAAVDSFFDRYGVPPGDVEPAQEQVPYYLLIVGTPERIPFSFQAELDITHASGRLCFRDPAAYARYARNLVDQEANEIRRDRRLTLFGSDNGDRITGLTSQYLVPPLAEKMSEIMPKGWRVDLIPPDLANKPTLADLLAGGEAPALLFTAGHGAVSSKKPIAMQGALICSEWQGGKLSADAYFCGADVSPDRDYRGLIAFFFACFSAGTPEFDSFAEPGKDPWRWHDVPFVADLPQALLGHERGPLAVIAHTDQAFQYSSLWNDNILGIAHFAGTFSRLMNGPRVGHAMEPCRRRYAAALASLKRARRLGHELEDAEL